MSYLKNNSSVLDVYIMVTINDQNIKSIIKKDNLLDKASFEVKDFRNIITHYKKHSYNPFFEEGNEPIIQVLTQKIGDGVEKNNSKLFYDDNNHLNLKICNYHQINFYELNKITDKEIEFYIACLLADNTYYEFKETLLSYIIEVS